MYLRTTQRRNKDGSVVRYLALAENRRHPEKGHVEARVIHSFGREDQLDRTALERLVASIRRVLGDTNGGPDAHNAAGAGSIAIEASFELGVVHVVQGLWARLGIGEAILAQVEAKQLQAPHAAALLAMVAQRLDQPGSKLACHERWLARVWLPEARGCFHGLTPAHGRGHLARAVLEGCAFAMRDVVDRLAEMGVATDSLLLLGGGARSAAWAQMRADVTGRPVTIPSCVDSAPVGAAMLGFVAAGRAIDLAGVAAALPRNHRMVTPDARKSAIYDAAYHRYRRLFEALRPLLPEPARDVTGH